MTSAPTPKQQKLESWKEIAAYINRDVRTARRWEKDRGLPVRRFPGTRSGVYALVSEIDEWVKHGTNGRPAERAAEQRPSAPAKRIPMVWLLVVSAPLLSLALLAVFRPAPAGPRLGNLAEVTHNGWTKTALLRRGNALYYQAKDPGSGMRESIRRINDSGRDQFLATLPPDPGNSLLDVNPDGSSLLFLHPTAHCDSELWEMPVASGQPHRIGNMCTRAAAWSPDGTRLAYHDGHSLYVSHSDGTAPRKLAVLPYREAAGLRWSPDGRRLRFVLRERQVQPERSRLWEAQIDRGIASRLLPGWSPEDADEEKVGQWTSDGHFFVFGAIHKGTDGIWALRDDFTALGRWNSPILLTAVSSKVGNVAPGPDGKKIFALMNLPRRGELISLNPKTQEFGLEPKWNWLSGGQLAFSPVGRRVAYLSYPEHMLWTADIDGKNPHLLSTGSLRGALPQWSPNGRRLAFMSWIQGTNGPTRIRIAAPDGQDAFEPVTLPGWQGAPSWTSDDELIFGDNAPRRSLLNSCSLHSFTLKNHSVADLPNTGGLWTARPCPTGRYVAAQTTDMRRLMLYDRQTARSIELFRSPEGDLGDNPTWSRDGAYIYMDVPYAHDPAIYRIRIADRTVVKIASLAGIQRVVEGIGLWMGFTPDESLLILRRLDGSEIDSWDWVGP